MSAIELEGVRVHNLKNVSLKLPLKRLIVFTGVSGSGKSSLAFDTLYAEGQRRYIEGFSAYARQFLDRLERPDADRIDNIPPAIAVRQNSVSQSARSTIASATETHDYLRLLFAKIGHIICPDCQAETTHESPESVQKVIQQLPEGTRFQVCFPVSPDDEDETIGDTLQRLKEDGFSRLVVDGQMQSVDDGQLTEKLKSEPIWAIVDRLTAGKSTDERLLDSIELAFRYGNDRCVILNESAVAETDDEHTTIDDRSWRVQRFNRRLACDDCDIEFIPPEPRLFSYNNPLGACPECHGFGSVATISFDQIVPDPSKSLRDGAIAPWTTPGYKHELDELLALADEYSIPVDVPFSELQPEHLQLIREGVPEREFGGLKGFYRWLEKHRYKMSVRVFLNRWRAYETCPLCKGGRLQRLSLCVRIDGKNIADICSMTIGEASVFFERLVEKLTKDEKQLAEIVTHEIRSRLEFLNEAGIEYLTLDRTMRTLSTGEAQRVALTGILGSSLVNTLYVLDEPSAGLHPRDNERLIGLIKKLRDVGNTVIVVEHEEAFVRVADEVVDIGPGAGRNGGRVVFQGPPNELASAEDSITGAYLSGRKKIKRNGSDQQRQPNGWLKLEGAKAHNLKNLTVEFPLGVLCVIAGVSGSGKSTLIQQTLYPALCRELKQPCAVNTHPKFDKLFGIEQIDEVILADQSPIGRTSRSNPVTYMKAFDEIRKTFAQIPEAKLRNFTARHFSFNAKDGGRCERCNGAGSLNIEMQFLADIAMTCPECHGTRFQREVLEVKYRGVNIAEVLAMTVEEAFAFFRSQRKLQKKLSFLKDVGLEYLPLGQPATTLSGGESQRLKLASFLASGSKSRTLFLLDEPTTGLHTADVEKLLDCFDSLLAVGHSLIVIEHNLDVIRSADHVIDLGPEAGEAGGQIVAAGSPDEISGCESSITGRFLREG